MDMFAAGAMSILQSMMGPEEKAEFERLDAFKNRGMGNR